jgi:hypothetical protein
MEMPIERRSRRAGNWRTSMRDAELREYAHEGWARYRAPFTRTVLEGRDTGFFAPTVGPDEVVVCCSPR